MSPGNLEMWTVFKSCLINNCTYHIWVWATVHGRNEQWKKSTLRKGIKRERVVQKDGAERDERGQGTRGQRNGIKSKRCEIKKNKVPKKEGRERTRIHGWVEGLTWNKWWFLKEERVKGTWRLDKRKGGFLRIVSDAKKGGPDEMNRVTEV